MEEIRCPAEERDPREIVEVYRPAPPEEVVEYYCRPLPVSMAQVWIEEEERARRRHRRQRSRRRNLRVFVLLALLAGVAAAWLWLRPAEPSAGAELPFIPQEQEKSREIGLAKAPTDGTMRFYVDPQGTEVMPLQEIYRRVNPAVVTVMVDLGERGGFSGMSVGTGVLFTADGYIVTNYHVLEGGRDCSVALDDGTVYQAAYVAGDAENDLAVLKVTAENLPAAPFANSGALEVGDEVYAIGNPLGVELRGTLTDGIVSAINRDVWVEGVTMTLIQTNAALNEGNSGGPLINRYGQVVGINVVKMVDGDSSVEGLGFAIPTASAERIINDLVRFGAVQPKCALGLQVLRAGEEIAPGVRGIKVEIVDAGSVSEEAGILPGDYIIRAGGMDITSSEDLLLSRDRHYAGEDFAITVMRGEEALEFTVTLR